MNVPFCIVKGKSRLGTLVHKKNAAVLALTTVNEADKSKLAALTESFKSFNAAPKSSTPVMGKKTQVKLEKRRIAIEAELKKKRDAEKR